MEFNKPSKPSLYHHCTDTVQAAYDCLHYLIASVCFRIWNRVVLFASNNAEIHTASRYIAAPLQPGYKLRCFQPDYQKYFGDLSGKLRISLNNTSLQLQALDVFDWIAVHQYMEAVAEDNTWTFTDIQRFSQFQMLTRAGMTSTAIVVNNFSNHTENRMSHLQHQATTHGDSMPDSNDVPIMCSSRLCTE